MTERTWTNADEKKYLHYIGVFRKGFDYRGCEGAGNKSPGEVYVDKVLAGDIDCHGFEYLRERIIRLERYVRLADVRDDWCNMAKLTCVGYALAEIRAAQKLLKGAGI